MATSSRRRTGRLAIWLLGVLAIVFLGGLYFTGDLSRFQIDNSVEESRAAMAGVTDLDRLDQVLKRYPSNRILKMVALANRDAIEMDAAARGLLSEADLGDIAKRIDLTAAGRSDLEALGRELKAAKENAAGFMPRYLPLIKAVRDKIETDARAPAAANAPANLMAMIDEQHADMTRIMSKLSAARADYYGSYEKCIALLVRDFGITKVVKGQFIFQYQSAADSYNGAATAMMTAAKRMNELEAERAGFRSAQLDKWKSFVARD